MPSFDTKVGEGSALVTVFYDCDCDGVIEIDEVWFKSQRITATLTQATVDQIEKEAEADYKKHCEDRNTEPEQSGHQVSSSTEGSANVARIAGQGCPPRP